MLEPSAAGMSTSGDTAQGPAAGVVAQAKYGGGWDQQVRPGLGSWGMDVIKGCLERSGQVLGKPVKGDESQGWQQWEA